jgi:hypothetical protein
MSENAAIMIRNFMVLISSTDSFINWFLSKLVSSQGEVNMQLIVGCVQLTVLVLSLISA